ncbi:xanthine dehydrogenase YagR molybdenum-binding subunit [Streptosporangium subroseum]|uniref:Xanthine dehydrogenase YagR molybdenum-binding subunit n=1 Tax=Streptosporangium subroseum TaxID=106412 RepID=A0A239LHX0_9ACTN|nr:molybdopterin-dependent oxidoreductase [Streptosporangium subroseum]SNT29433.1 xanthine dehydrogenase YagR molybdenum-binding subunit [Streptosporangium subroseum]
MKIILNGVPTVVDAHSGDVVVDVLREGQGLTGAKAACRTGVCGACTVMVDGVPQASCLLPAAAAREREITTVEGLDHPVQRAFAVHDGLQCGYCTPGFVVEAAAFVDAWRASHGDVAPPRERIAAAMAGHLCRCGAYQGIYAAIAAACRGEHDGDAGVPARVEAMDKVTGRARYTTDVRLDGQLEGVIVRSTRAHARVTAVKVDAAHVIDLLPPDRIVRYAGQPVAAVAAPTRREALAIAEGAEIGYDPIPAALDDAPGAPVVYDEHTRKQAPSASEGLELPGPWNGNVHGPFTRASWRGRTAVKRIEAARGAADPRLVTGTFTTAVQVHTPLEPHACVARWDTGGDLHLYLSTQSVGLVAEQAAKRWNLPAERVHVTADHVGGAFGAKNGITAETIAAVELARACGAPVRVVFSRADELTDAGNRPGTRTTLELLTDDKGDLAALTVDAHGRGGVSVGSAVAVFARLMYGTAPRRLRDYDVITNEPPGTPFRGPGAPPMLWALEQAVDEVAHRRGEDPIALRRRWDGNRKRHALYDWAAALPAWAGRAAAGSQEGRFRRGIGVAAANWAYMLDPGTEIELQVEGDVVVARTTTQDIGTGIRSVIAEILRDELGLPAERVRVEIGRTGTVHGPPSIGSRTTTSVAPAVRDAARRLRERGLADGAKVVGRRRRDRRGYVTPIAVGGMALGRGFSGAVHVTEVEVDTRFGTVRPLRVWAGIAVGHIYAERLARSQCEGGIVQGIGYALYEERHVDPVTGTVLTANLDDYRIPGIGDTPEMTVHFHQDGWEHVNGRGVGVGEVSTIGVAASVGNAVHNATGWRPHDLPIRPDRLLEGMRK